MSRKPINQQLRDAIARCGKSRYRISQETGVSQAVLSRFVSGQTELTIANAEKLCTAVGVELVVRKSKAK